jgi:hypothetical protein
MLPPWERGVVDKIMNRAAGTVEGILAFGNCLDSVAAFLSRFFIAWEIKYIKPPKYCPS